PTGHLIAVVDGRQKQVPRPGRVRLRLELLHHRVNRSGPEFLGLGVLRYMYHVTHPRNASMSDATFTFRVDEELKSRFAEAAKARDRTGAQLLRDFMRDFVARQEAAQYDTWFREQVQ